MNEDTRYVVDLILRLVSISDDNRRGGIDTAYENARELGSVMDSLYKEGLTEEEVFKLMGIVPWPLMTVNRE